jgi:hypothetical protein
MNPRTMFRVLKVLSYNGETVYGGWMGQDTTFHDLYAADGKISARHFIVQRECDWYVTVLDTHKATMVGARKPMGGTLNRVVPSRVELYNDLDHAEAVLGMRRANGEFKMDLVDATLRNLAKKQWLVYAYGSVIKQPKHSVTISNTDLT